MNINIKKSLVRKCYSVTVPAADRIFNPEEPMEHRTDVLSEIPSSAVGFEEIGATG